MVCSLSLSLFFYLFLTSFYFSLFSYHFSYPLFSSVFSSRHQTQCKTLIYPTRLPTTRRSNVIWRELQSTSFSVYSICQGIARDIVTYETFFSLSTNLSSSLGMVMRLYLSLDGQCQDDDVCFHDILSQTSRAIKALTLKATQAQSTPPETEGEEHLWQEHQKQKDKVRIYKCHSDILKKKVCNYKKVHQEKFSFTVLTNSKNYTRIRQITNITVFQNKIEKTV